MASVKAIDPNLDLGNGLTIETYQQSIHQVSKAIEILQYAIVFGRLAKEQSQRKIVVCFQRMNTDWGSGQIW
jgi:hypothetical protein